ncbi:MAG: valine--tRNA ligase [Holosporaceae bacterium]|jgi:valyl-tRNA synthetase|nr:valine--tRNA ligase [Holosporaceae bacterium]
MLDKNFDPKSFEKNFSFDIEASTRKPDAEPFMVLLPPPNVTGSLHMGHALCFTIQDIVARYKRLKGYDVLFQPGLDHAGIVTQLLVEKQLYANGIKKENLTREALLKEIWLSKENSGAAIINQLKILGISCDFSRLRFTMDEDAKKAVAKMFVKLFDDGLLYRGRRMVNWDPLIGSAISDLEVVEKEIDGHLWHLKYMFADEDGYITVATTRPETLFGDTAVAVNPLDERYKRFVGKEVVVPLTDRKIKIIADKYADPEKGTGAVKITPAHDFNDYEVSFRHKLKVIEIMNAKGEMNENVPEIFQRMDRFKAREKVVELLEKKGLLEKIENIKQKVPFGDRSNVPLEPRITYQWFVNCKKLAEAAIEAVKEGKTRFVPRHWENLYFRWLEEIRPWCVSRQIWWGHRIPAWHGPDGQYFVAENLEEATAKATKFYGKNKVELTQDEDVLDTWFSSGMWPFVTLGWPKETDDLKRFYSKMIVVTGFDIIFFWIARMMMSGLYCMGEVPFPEVYIHGLVRDEKGQKMSKSKGNVINPLSLCEKYGADAVRYALASLSSPGRDVKINERIVETIGRNFLTKLWNVVRFAQMNGCLYNKDFEPKKAVSPITKWIVRQVSQMVSDVEESIEGYRFDEATGHIYRCLWNSFCDWFMEFAKPILQRPSPILTDDKPQEACLRLILLKKEIRDAIAWAIVQFTRVLYPIAPFISKKLSGEMGILDMTWPDIDKNLDFKDDVEEIELLKMIISSVRSTKQCLRLPPSEKINVRLENLGSDIESFVSKYEEILSRMAGIIVGEVAGQTVPVVVNGAIIHMECEGKINIKEEKTRLRNEIAKLKRNREETLSRLMNDDFLSKASEEVVQEHKKRVDEINDRIQKVDYILQNLNVM